MQDILEWHAETGRPLWQLVAETEGSSFFSSYLPDIWEKMKSSINSGLNKNGILYGKLNLPRRARDMMVKARRLKQEEARTGLLSGYALAVSEENADGGFVVTAPTFGACGIVPGVLYFFSYEKNTVTDQLSMRW